MTETRPEPVIVMMFMFFLASVMIVDKLVMKHHKCSVPVVAAEPACLEEADGGMKCFRVAIRPGECVRFEGVTTNKQDGGRK